MAVSGVLGSEEVMGCIRPGDHGSTFGGNPLAMAVAHTSVKVIKEEGMVDNANFMGSLLKNEIKALKSPLLKDICGRGLMIGVVVDNKYKVSGIDFAKICLKNGLLVKCTHGETVEIMPPLNITKDEVKKVVQLLKQSLVELSDKAFNQ